MRRAYSSNWMRIRPAARIPLFSLYRLKSFVACRAVPDSQSAKISETQPRANRTYATPVFDIYLHSGHINSGCLTLRLSR